MGASSPLYPLRGLKPAPTYRGQATTGAAASSGYVFTVASSAQIVAAGFSPRKGYDGRKREGEAKPSPLYPLRGLKPAATICGQATTGAAASSRYVFTVVYVARAEARGYIPRAGYNGRGRKR